MSPKDHVPQKLSLDYLIREPISNREKAPVLIMFHGFGSNEADPFPIASGIPPEFLVISVRGPITLGEGQYAWYPLDWSSGRPVGDPKEAEKARVVVKNFVEEVITHFEVDPARVFLLGFSQGTIMSLSVALTTPTLITGVIALSGRILPELKPVIIRSPELLKVKIFLAHGTLDQVLPIVNGREAKHYLEELGIMPEYHEYEMGHGIIRDEQKAFLNWLSRAAG